MKKSSYTRHEKSFKLSASNILLPQKSHNAKILFNHSGPILGASMFEVKIRRLSNLFIQQREEREVLAKRDWFCS